VWPQRTKLLYEKAQEFFIGAALSADVADPVLKFISL
jgi:hypothetical protein